jgi:hypothetical protein
MKKLKIKDGARATFSLAWEFPILNNRGDEVTPIVLTGRDLNSYGRALRDEVRRRRGVIIRDRSDLEQALRRINPGPHGLSPIVLVHSVDERINGRYSAALRKGGVDTWTIDDYHERLFFDDHNFRDIDDLKKTVSLAVNALDQGLVYYNAEAVPLSYFRILAPLIIASCEKASWMIIASGRMEEFAQFPSMEREYIKYDELVEVFSGVYRIDAESIEKILIESVAGGRPSKYLPDMTEHELELAFHSGSRAIQERAGQFLPPVPLGLVAPIEFQFQGRKITATDQAVETTLTRAHIHVIVAELVAQVDDVPLHFHLHNVAPACNAKLMRVRDHLVEIEGHGISEGRILTLGIRTQACREHLSFEVENLERPAEGAIHTALAQIENFLNRFPAWRVYCQDGDPGSHEVVTPNELEPAIGAMAAFNNAEIVDAQGAIALNRALYEARNGATTKIERQGVLRVLHNLASRAFAVLKDGVAADWKANSSKIFYRSLATAAVVAEPFLKSLAETHPMMFGWTVPFIAWLTRVAGI